MKFVNYLVVFVFMIGFVSAAISICVDLMPPSAPGDLVVSGKVGSILLSWDAAVDTPNCSGIGYYNISRNGKWIGVVEGNVLSFVDGEHLGEGDYSYYVYAVDMVGRNAGASVMNTIKINHGGGGSGGSRSSSRICDVDWSCTAWGDCTDGSRMRVCEDLNKCNTPYLKPVDVESCNSGEMSMAQIVEPAEVIEEEEFFSLMTGAVTGVGNGFNYLGNLLGRVAGWFLGLFA